MTNEQKMRETFIADLSTHGYTKGQCELAWDHGAGGDFDLLAFVDNWKSCWQAATQSALEAAAKHEDRWCYGIQAAIEMQDRQAMIDRLVLLCEQQAAIRALAAGVPKAGA